MRTTLPKRAPRTRREKAEATNTLCCGKCGTALRARNLPGRTEFHCPKHGRVVLVVRPTGE